MSHRFAAQLYAEAVGGVVSDGEIEAIPFNHWKQDCEWMVMIIEGRHSLVFIPSTGRTVREAVYNAIDLYLGADTDDD